MDGGEAQEREYRAAEVKARRNLVQTLHRTQVPAYLDHPMVKANTPLTTAIMMCLNEEAFAHASSRDLVAVVALLLGSFFSQLDILDETQKQLKLLEQQLGPKPHNAPQVN